MGPHPAGVLWVFLYIEGPPGPKIPMGLTQKRTRNTKFSSNPTATPSHTCGFQHRPMAREKEPGAERLLLEFGPPKFGAAAFLWVSLAEPKEKDSKNTCSCVVGSCL